MHTRWSLFLISSLSKLFSLLLSVATDLSLAWAQWRTAPTADRTGNTQSVVSWDETPGREADTGDTDRSAVNFPQCQSGCQGSGPDILSSTFPLSSCSWPPWSLAQAPVPLPVGVFGSPARWRWSAGERGLLWSLTTSTSGPRCSTWATTVSRASPWTCSPGPAS